jgi:hypothetical protein
MGGRRRIALTVIVVLLAGAIVAPPIATPAGASTKHGRKCGPKGAHGMRRCRLRARIAISPPGHDFGTIGPVDSAPTDFVVSNVGRRASGIPAASIGGSAPGYFQIDATTCSSRLSPGTSCTVTVQSVHNDGGTGLARLDVSATPGGAGSAPLLVNLF